MTRRAKNEGSNVDATAPRHATAASNLGAEDQRAGWHSAAVHHPRLNGRISALRREFALHLPSKRLNFLNLLDGDKQEGARSVELTGRTRPATVFEALARRLLHPRSEPDDLPGPCRFEALQDEPRHPRAVAHGRRDRLILEDAAREGGEHVSEAAGVF